MFGLVPWLFIATGVAIGQQQPHPPGDSVYLPTIMIIPSASIKILIFLGVEGGCRMSDTPSPALANWKKFISGGITSREFREGRKYQIHRKASWKNTPLVHGSSSTVIPSEPWCLVQSNQFGLRLLWRWLPVLLISLPQDLGMYIDLCFFVICRARNGVLALVLHFCVLKYVENVGGSSCSEHFNQRPRAGSRVGITPTWFQLRLKFVKLFQLHFR